MIEDEAVVEAILDGRTEYFRILVERYRTYLYQVVYSIVRHPKDAEDVTQDVFLKLYSALPQYRKQGFKTWITRIATNKAIDHVRKMRRRKEEADDRIEDRLGDMVEEYQESEQELLVLKQEQKDLLYEHIGEMPENYRDVIVAYYLEEKSYQQIAVDQNLEIKSVESRLYRARQWIRKHWKEEDFR